MNGKNETPDAAPQEGNLSGRLGAPGEPSHRSSGVGEGQQSLSNPERPRYGELGPSAKTPGHHWGGRHSERVPHPREIEALEEKLTRAFQGGDPGKAWEVSRQLVELAKESVAEAARARFKVNFGTPRCDSCEGLKAGPDVAATCFQVRQCFYGNIKQGELTPKQGRVLKLFLGLDPT